MNKYSPPLVSVILCTYNDEKYIAKAIDSILNQSYKNLEFIIINDGSTDNTKAVITAFKDKRIRYYEHLTNKGQETSKNLGIIKAVGKYIAYMDGDDISLENRLEIQVDFMERHPKIGICSAAIKYFGSKNTVFRTVEHNEQIQFQSLFHSPLPHPTCMIRSAILQKYELRYKKGWEAAEDYYFLFTVLKHTKAYCIQKPLYLYRWHDKNISITKSAQQMNYTKEISALVFKALLPFSISKQEHSLLYKLHTNLHALDSNDVESVIKLHDNMKKHLLEQREQKSINLLKMLTKNIERLLFIRFTKKMISNPTTLKKLPQNKVKGDISFSKLLFFYIKSSYTYLQMRFSQQKFTLS